MIIVTIIINGNIYCLLTLLIIWTLQNTMSLMTTTISIFLPFFSNWEKHRHQGAYRNCSAHMICDVERQCSHASYSNFKACLDTPAYFFYNQWRVFFLFYTIFITVAKIHVILNYDCSKIKHNDKWNLLNIKYRK